MEFQAKDILKRFEADIADLSIDDLHIKYLGKKGELNKAFADLINIPVEQKKVISSELNAIKKKIEESIKDLREKILDKNIDQDLTIPVLQSKTGNLHPLTLATRDLNNFFHYLGFSVADGPEIEQDYYNFEMMGVPKDHPAREMQDTLYILEPEILLRTQTSSIEARLLSDRKLPMRYVCPGKVYRNETTNKTNGAFFHQYQGFYVDRNVTLGHLKWFFTRVIKHIVGEDTTIRFRSKYYPEVEPSLSPDILCTFCHGKGCPVCKQRGWIEIAGGGMIHPSIFDKAGIDRKEYSGFAFGFGLDRLAMARFGIKDIRTMLNGKIIYDINSSNKE